MFGPISHDSIFKMKVVLAEVLPSILRALKMDILAHGVEGFREGEVLRVFLKFVC